jgi:hypothetical protein
VMNYMQAVTDRVDVVDVGEDFIYVSPSGEELTKVEWDRRRGQALNEADDALRAIL